jgi:hypothetical protein
VFLTVGMAAYKDFKGVYATVRGLRIYHRQALELHLPPADRQVELAVVDNYGCDSLQGFCKSWDGQARYERFTQVQGTAAPRDRLFRTSRARFVACLDAHLFAYPYVMQLLLDYLRAHPDTDDLLQGVFVHPDDHSLITGMRPQWGGGMLGTFYWDKERAAAGQPFDVWAQGLGFFCMRREAFLDLGGFHPKFRGFGGEEGYLHELVRRNGGRTLVHPELRFDHRFDDDEPKPYQPNDYDKFRNYLLGHKQLAWEPRPVIEHFVPYVGPADMKRAIKEVHG